MYIKYDKSSGFDMVSRFSLLLSYILLFSLILITFLFVFISLCSCSETTQRLDRYYNEKNEIEVQLNDTSLSEIERNSLLNKLSAIEKKISNTASVFAVNILPDSLDLGNIPFASEDLSKIGEWYYNNII